MLQPLASLGVAHFLLSALTTVSTLSASEAAEPDAPQVDSPAKAAPSHEPVAAEAATDTDGTDDLGRLTGHRVVST